MEKWKKNGKGVICCKYKNLEEEGLRWYFEKGRYKVKSKKELLYFFGVRFFDKLMRYGF